MEHKSFELSPSNEMTTSRAAAGSIHENAEGDHESKSVLLLFTFFFAILALFSIGLGLLYLYYRYSYNKRKSKQEREQRARTERQQQIRYKALAAAQFFRGIPNSYSPNPKDENTLLLGMDMAVVPIQLQNQHR